MIANISINALRMLPKFLLLYFSGKLSVSKSHKIWNNGQVCSSLWNRHDMKSFELHGVDDVSLREESLEQLQEKAITSNCTMNKCVLEC